MKCILREMKGGWYQSWLWKAKILLQWTKTSFHVFTAFKLLNPQTHFQDTVEGIILFSYRVILLLLMQIVIHDAELDAARILEKG